LDQALRSTTTNADTHPCLSDRLRAIGWTPNPGASDPWLLVTSAAHMPRAVGVFRREGFYIQPYPVDWRTRGREDWAVPFRWASSGLARVDAAAHEWVGLVVYYLTGRTLTLFPAP